MSTAINLKEHNSAFIRFLILFIITVAMVAGALYFDFQTPQKELEILRERSDLLRDQNLAQENYKRTLLDAMAVVEKLDSTNNKLMINSELETKMSLLKNSINIDDSTSAKRLNAVITLLLNKYVKASFEVYDTKDAQKLLNEKDRQIFELKDNLDRARRNEARITQ